MFKFELKSGQKLTATEAADALDLISRQISEGFTSGDAGGAGWWSVDGLKDDVFYQVDDGDGVLIVIGDDDAEFPAHLTSWDTSDTGRDFLEGLAEKMNEGYDADYCKGLLADELAQVRLRRLGYSWTDDWRTGQQRWTLTGPDGEIRLPSGGFHGWSEAVEVATKDANRRGLDAQPPA